MSGNTLQSTAARTRRMRAGATITTAAITMLAVAPGVAHAAERYTVKPGDTPSSIAEEAGIPLERLLELNPDIDPQALSPGQRLRLR